MLRNPSVDGFSPAEFEGSMNPKKKFEFLIKEDELYGVFVTEYLLRSI